jgi:hypothetical protein
MIAFFTTVATDFQGMYSAMQAAVVGVWTFFASAPSVIVSVF